MQKMTPKDKAAVFMLARKLLRVGSTKRAALHLKRSRIFADTLPRASIVALSTSVFHREQNTLQ